MGVGTTFAESAICESKEMSFSFWYSVFSVTALFPVHSIRSSLLKRSLSGTLGYRLLSVHWRSVSVPPRFWPCLNQFIVEVDLSDLGMGEVLSQWANEDNRVHPCAFFSRRLSPVERNYDMGDRDLLAVKLALEEYILPRFVWLNITRLDRATGLQCPCTRSLSLLYW